MLTCREYPDIEVFEVVVDGYVTREDYKDVVEKLNKFADRHGKVRLLENVKSFGGMDIGVFWDDLVYVFNHLEDFTRCAVVSDKAWVAWFSKVAALAGKCEVRSFSAEDEKEALNWLSEHAWKHTKSA